MFTRTKSEKMRWDCFERYDNFGTDRKPATWWNAVKGDAIHMQRAHFWTVIQVIFC